MEKALRCRGEKAERIVGMLKKVEAAGDETLKNVCAIILEKVDFYERARQQLQHYKWKKTDCKWTEEEIETGLTGSNAGLDMAEAIANELRFQYEQKAKWGGNNK